MKRLFTCHYWLISFTHLSVGFHISLDCPNIEIHLPFGFIRIGWEKAFTYRISAWKCNSKDGFGLTTVTDYKSDAWNN